MQTFVAIALVATQCFAQCPNEECASDETVLLQTGFQQGISAHSDELHEKTTRQDPEEEEGEDESESVCGMSLLPAMPSDATVENAQAAFQNTCEEAYSSSFCEGISNELFNIFTSDGGTFAEQKDTHPHFCNSMYELVTAHNDHSADTPIESIALAARAGAMGKSGSVESTTLSKAHRRRRGGESRPAYGSSGARRRGVPYNYIPRIFR